MDIKFIIVNVLCTLWLAFDEEKEKTAFDIWTANYLDLYEQC